MKKLFAFALTVILAAALVLPVSAAEDGTFDITEYPSDAKPDKIGATVEAYRFVYDADIVGEEQLSGEYVHSIPKLTYETETAQTINQKILEDFNKTQPSSILSMMDIGSEPWGHALCETNYTSLIDSKGIVAIILRLDGALISTCANYCYYRIYYYSPETDSELSVDEYLALHGTSREEISARFSDENDYLKWYDPESAEISNVPAEDINFAIYYADGTETVCAEVSGLAGNYIKFFGNQIDFSPATSLTTAVYAAVAALALGVVVVKKRK